MKIRIKRTLKNSLSKLGQAIMWVINSREWVIEERKRRHREIQQEIEKSRTPLRKAEAELAAIRKGTMDLKNKRQINHYL